MRNFHFTGRSPVYARTAMCATSHPLASEAAIDILKNGGNAVDAALAASAVLAVIEPHMTGIGGDCFALLHRPGKDLISISGVGRSPQAAKAEWYAENNITQVEHTNPHAVTVPGAIDAWCQLSKDHGKLPLTKVFEAAIHYAKEGFAISPRTSWDWKRFEEKLTIHEKTKERYLTNGQAPTVGDVLQLPELANTLQDIAENGRDAFYAGPIAEDMVATLNALGGLHTIEDFAVQTSDYVTPITARYGDLDIYELPPSNHGVTALMMLKILSRIKDRGQEPVSATRYHVMMEAARLSYAVRDQFLADPDVMEVSADDLISDRLADQLAGRINPKARTEDLGPIPNPTNSDTIYLCVVDKDGMAVSFINSIFSAFGSGITSSRSGILFNSRGAGFRFTPGHVNSIAPRKRPMHTLIPGMAFQNGKPTLVFGVMGAAFQPSGHVHAITNLVDYGLDPQEALDSPRIFFDGDSLSLEDSIPENINRELQAMGHKTSYVTEPWGGGQMIQIDHDRGVLIGASDPRKDGAALGY